MSNLQRERTLPKRFWSEIVPTVLVAVLILVFAFWKEQTVLKTLPTLITLVVQILMAHANRYGFLLGGCNAALYGIGYLTEGLYFSAGSSILFSFPMQIWSFFHWKKHSSGQTVELRVLRLRFRVLTVAGTLAGWFFCLFVLRPLFSDAVFPELDAYLFVSGVVVTVLMGFRIVEAQYLNLISGVLNLILWILIVIKDPADMNYLIISVYNLIRTAEAAVRWTVQYLRQTKKMEE